MCVLYIPFILCYTTESKSCTSVVLPILLDQGLRSSVPEVRGLSLDVLSKVSRTAGHEALKPLLPQLVDVSAVIIEQAFYQYPSLRSCSCICSCGRSVFCRWSAAAMRFSHLPGSLCMAFLILMVFLASSCQLQQLLTAPCSLSCTCYSVTPTSSSK